MTTETPAMENADLLNMDFDKAVQVLPDDHHWIASPADGVSRVPLERVSALHTYSTESTALVWWPENEVFQPHTHWGGEEIVVIKGVFRDEFGEYPAGSWIRSPHLSEHFPRVVEETLILVKVGHLPQIRPQDMINDK